MSRVRSLLLAAGVSAALLTFALTPALASAKAKPTPTPSAHATARHKAKHVRPKATPKPKVAAVPNGVTFAVWGNDGGNGTDITFSSDSNNHDTTAEIAGGTQQVPAWSSNAIPFNSSAEFYSVDASFQGPGTIYCSVTVEQSGHRYYKQGQASASAGSIGEACDAQLNGLLGSWS